MEAQTAQSTKWILDPIHSELTFKVRHMMITNVKVEFKNFSVQVNGDDIFKSRFEVVVDASSIDTNSPDRDNHLRSGDFFDVDNFKEIKFNSTSFTKKSEDRFLLTGQLTLKGITNEVSLDIEFGGIRKDPMGNEKAGFSATGVINRKDWGLNWNAALETGGVLVSDEVKIFAEIQFVKQS